MQSNTKAAGKHSDVKTHGGVPAYPHLSPLEQLRRSVMACLLWEDQFYEDGVSIADRIAQTAREVSTEELAALAIEARSVHNLRHVPLLLLRQLSERGGSRIVGDTIYEVIQRADELAEFLALYWTPKRRPLAKQVKLGLARAFGKFDEYALAKYDRAKAIRLRDVLFMVHAKPRDEAQAALWKRLVDNELATPGTWENRLSAGENKRDAWESLLREGELGYLALLRNLRNMLTAGVDVTLIRDAILARKGARRVLPFRYVAAARAAPMLEPELDDVLCAAITEMPALPGRTLVVVDVSGSMDCRLSAKSDMTRMVAAAALSSLLHGDLRVMTFSYHLVEVPPRRGLAGVDIVLNSQPHGGTDLAGAVREANRLPHDRLIVITDEQATTGRVPDPVAPRAYMINVGSYKNGVGYGKWTHVDGFSEGVLRWIYAHEEAGANEVSIRNDA